MTPMGQHVMDPLSGEELVRMSCLGQTVKEERQVVVEVELFNLDLGEDREEGDRRERMVNFNGISQTWTKCVIMCDGFREEYCSE